MAKKTTPPPTEQKDTDVSLIKSEFQAPAEFKFPNKEESLKIIQAKKDEYSKLTIAGVDDNDGYYAVKSAMAEMKNTRVALTKAAKENVSDKVSKFLKDFKADLEELENALSAVESELREKKDEIDAQKEKIKQEKALAAQKALEKRISDLFVLGAVLNGQLYTFPYDSGLQINSLQLKEFGDEEFGEFLAEVQVAYDSEQIRLADEERLEKIAEQERQEEAERQRVIAQENERQAFALVEKRRNLRMKELRMLGVYQQETATNINMVIDRHSEIEGGKVSFRVCDMIFVQDATEEEWEALIESIENYVPPVEELSFESTTNAIFNPDSHINQRVDPDLLIDESEVETLIDTDENTEIIEEFHFFRNNGPYKEINLTPNMRVRIFPDEFEKEASDGVDIINQGVFAPRMSWLVMKKPGATKK